MFELPVERMHSIPNIYYILYKHANTHAKQHCDEFCLKFNLFFLGGGGGDIEISFLAQCSEGNVLTKNMCNRSHKEKTASIPVCLY